MSIAMLAYRGRNKRGYKGQKGYRGYKGLMVGGAAGRAAGSGCITCSTRLTLAAVSGGVGCWSCVHFTLNESLNDVCHTAYA